MVQNWNCALKAAIGEYITVLEDKMIFYPNALKEIKKIINKSTSGVVIWTSDIFDDNYIPNRLIQFTPSGQEVVTSNYLLKLVSEDILKCWGRLPRSLSCVFPRNIIMEINNNLGSEFYEPMSPDFISAIKILAHVEEVITVYKSYTLVISAKASTGNNSILGEEAALKYYSGKNIASLSVEYVSVKNKSIVVNSLVNDFRNLAKRYGGRIRGYRIDNKNYVKMMTRDLIISTFYTKKILWDRNTFFQLIKTDKRTIRNIFYMISYTIKFVLFHILKLIGISNTKQKKIVSTFENDQLSVLSLFLSGETDLGIVKRFNVIKR